MNDSWYWFSVNILILTCLLQDWIDLKCLTNLMAAILNYNMAADSKCRKSLSWVLNDEEHWRLWNFGYRGILRRWFQNLPDPRGSTTGSAAIFDFNMAAIPKLWKSLYWILKDRGTDLWCTLAFRHAYFKIGLIWNVWQASWPPSWIPIWQSWRNTEKHFFLFQSDTWPYYR